MRPILSCPPYFACENGHIWRDGHCLAEQSNGHGYMRVTVSLSGMTQDRYVHRLVCEAYHGEPPAGFECRHIDGSRDNNVPDNLAWGTKAENEVDKIGHGTVVQGEKNGQAILTEAMVIDARARTKAGEPMDTIAIEFGVASHTLRDAVMGRKWKSVPGALEPYSTRRRFSDDQVRAIRAAHGTKSLAKIAADYGVTENAIRQIVNRISYTHVDAASSTVWDGVDWLPAAKRA